MNSATKSNKNPTKIQQKKPNKKTNSQIPTRPYSEHCIDEPMHANAIDAQIAEIHNIKFSEPYINKLRKHVASFYDIIILFII